MPNELQGLLGGMQATPRNKLMGLLADGLKAADRYANKPDPTMPGGKANPPLSLLSDLASLKSLAEVANNVSYGYPLTNKGVANVPFLKPETADALMMAPISPRNALAAAALAGGGDTAAMKAIFAGIGAKTADKAALAKAEKLAASGADPKAIWRDTGWFKGGDGKWRFEIDDSEVKSVVPLREWANRQNGQWMAPNVSAAWDAAKSQLTDIAPVRARRLFDHPDLKDAYPYGFTKSIDNQSIMDMPVQIHGNGDNVAGSFNDGVLGLHQSLTPGEAKSTMLHELQHAVQQREGFARGGSLDSMPLVLEDLAEKKKAEARRLFDLAQRRDPLNPGDIVKPGAWDKAVEAEQKAGEYRNYLERIGSFGDGYALEAYRRLAGEAEARAVQSRMNLNPQQRREVFPLDSYDVPINSLIYR